MGLTIILQEMTHSTDYQTASFWRKNFRINHKNIYFLAYVDARLAKLAQFEEYFAKQGKVQIDKVMKINSRYNVQAVRVFTVLNWSSCRIM